MAKSEASDYVQPIFKDRALKHLVKLAGGKQVVKLFDESQFKKMMLARDKIASDMQFNACTKYDNSAMEMIERKYAKAGYNVPQIVFWNLNARDNVPVKADKSGAALVSGFSPSIVKAVLGADMSEFTPYGIMLKTIMNDRYAI